MSNYVRELHKIKSVVACDCCENGNATHYANAPITSTTLEGEQFATCLDCASKIAIPVYVCEKVAHDIKLGLVFTDTLGLQTFANGGYQTLTDWIAEYIERNGLEPTIALRCVRY